MMANSSLLQWLSTFKLEDQSPIEEKDDAYYNLADGYVCARILNQICPKYFSDKWLDGIKPVPPNGSWRLRVSNLKRILQKIHDFASDLQNPQFKTSAITPDVAVIAQNFDPDQISRLIQLILFCAINCDQREEYIQKIKDLPRQVQHDIKEAVEELLVRNEDGNNQKSSTSHATTANDSVQSEAGLGMNLSYRSNNSMHNVTRSPATRSIPQTRALLRRDSSQLSNDSNLDITTQLGQNDTIEDVRQRLSAALVLKDQKSQACHELELKLKQIQLERDQLAFENELLAEKKKQSTPTKTPESRRASAYGTRDADSSKSNQEKISNDDEQASDIVIAQARLQNKVHKLEDSMIKNEIEKEELRLKCTLLQEDLDKSTARLEEFRNKAELVNKLQDELDEYKHISEKVINYEARIENTVKKNSDLERELKALNEKNLSNIKKIVRLEEDNRQLTTTLSRGEIYKKQLQEAQIKLSEETHRADKAEIELNRLVEQYSAAKRENERLFKTTNQLQGALMNRAHGSPTSDNISSTKDRGLKDEDGDADNSLSKFELKEAITRLQVENELLLNKLNSKMENDNTVLSGLLENANLRCSKLEVENRQTKKKVLLLESRLKDLSNSQGGGGGPSTSTAAPSDLSSDNMFALVNRVEELQRLVFQREQEFMELDSKYRRSLHKAKEVYKSLNNNQSLSNSMHPSCMSSASSFNSSSLDETNILKQQLKDREERLIQMEREFSEFKRIKELHERLILSAFYSLTTPMQRKNADRRLDRTTLTSPTNTANTSIHSKHSH